VADIQLASIGLGFLIGAISALTGAGGSILAIPLLVIGLHLPLNEAIPIALLAVMSASSLGTVQGLLAKNVRYKSALLMALFGMAFAPLGIWLAKRAPLAMLNMLFATVLFFVAWRMWQQSRELPIADTSKPAPACMINPATSTLFWTAVCTKRLILTGIGAGFLSGLLGIGGGFVIVPSLRQVSNFSMQAITATSLAVIALISATSVCLYMLHDHVNWQIGLPFMLSSMLGMFACRSISDSIPTILSQRAFALLAVLAACLMLWKTLNSASF
jgi:uncharacterized protein